MDRRWFKRVRKEFSKAISPFAGKPIAYVEVGCWEGASASWACEHILTHPDSWGFGIDPYMRKEATRGRGVQQSEMDLAYDTMMETMSRFPNWSFIREPSEIALPKFSQPIDVLYIDGRHEALFVAMDFINAWQWLKVGSVVIFDDYSIGQRKPMPHVPEAIEAVSIMFAGLIEPVLPAGRQASFRVVKKTVDQEWHNEFMANPKENYQG